MNRKPLVCKAQKRTEKKGWACTVCAETYVRSQTDKPRVTRKEDRRTIPKARSHGLKQGPIFLGSRRGSVRGSTTSQKLISRSLLQREGLLGGDLERRAPEYEQEDEKLLMNFT